MLLPGFLSIAERTGKPLVLSEVGASAGLNLQFDRYRYRLGDFAWGEQSDVFLSPEWRGGTPPDGRIEVIERAGCDLNPLDPSSSEDRLRLMSYIWADQTDRLERTAAALRIAVENGLQVEKADAVDWLKRRLATQHTGATHVVYHSIAWQYLPDALKQAGEALIAEAGARATPEARLRACKWRRMRHLAVPQLPCRYGPPAINRRSAGPISMDNGWNGGVGAAKPPRRPPLPAIAHRHIPRRNASIPPGMYHPPCAAAPLPPCRKPCASRRRQGTSLETGPAGSRH